MRSHSRFNSTSVPRIVCNFAMTTTDANGFLCIQIDQVRRLGTRLRAPGKTRIQTSVSVHKGCGV